MSKREVALEAVFYAAIGFLVMIVGFPAFAGDLLDYADNPVHLAEAIDLATSNTGWTGLGFCGFPLTILQPPLTFGLLASVVRMGLPLAPAYSVLPLLGLAAPAFAAYYVARRRLPGHAAFVFAAAFVLYRGSLVGGGAALAGMFGFHLAAAALILVLDRLARPSRTLIDVAVIAALAAFIGLTHMYITISLVYVGLIHTAWSVWKRGPSIGRLRYDIPGLALGAISAAAYWMPNALARTAPITDPDSLVRQLFQLITTGTPNAPPGVGRGLARIVFDPAHYVDVLLQVLLLGLAVAAAPRALRDNEDDAPRYGLTLAAFFIFALALQQLTGVALLGPQGGRLVYVIRIGMFAAALASAPWLRRLPRAAWGACFVGVGLIGLGMLRVVSLEAVPTGSTENVALQRMWQYIGEHKTSSWGRVYLQTTFGNGEAGALGRSHSLVLGGKLAGIEQLGSYYGSTPYNRSWLFDSESYILGEPILDSTKRASMVARMDAANVSHVLVVGRANADAFADEQTLKLVHSVPPYYFFERAHARTAGWASVVEGAGTIGVERVSPGRMRLHLTGSPKVISVSESYHPFWTTEPPGRASISSDDAGLMRLAPASDERSLDIVYALPRFPRQITFAGLSLILLLYVLGWRRARSRI